MRYLIRSGANVNITDPDGDSPLFVCEDVESVKVLIEAGADPKHVNESGMTVSCLAEAIHSPVFYFLSSMVILTCTVHITLLCYTRLLRTHKKRNGWK